ncbi:hypothetical protein [Streptomyces lavendulae]|uniref:hypothetical protein n=1 Tax=Streptomyces lavendulae TaxID=1914 RepID=UPI003D9F8117
MLLLARPVSADHGQRLVDCRDVNREVVGIVFGQLCGVQGGPQPSMLQVQSLEMRFKPVVAGRSSRDASVYPARRNWNIAASSATPT